MFLQKFVQKSFRQKIPNHKAMFLLVKTRSVCETNTTPHFVRQGRSVFSKPSVYNQVLFYKTCKFSVYGFFKDLLMHGCLRFFTRFCVCSMFLALFFFKNFLPKLSNFAFSLDNKGMWNDL